MNKALKRLIKSYFRLLTAGVISYIILTITLLLLYEFFQKNTESDILIPNLFDGLIVLLITSFLFICFIIWWTIRITKNIQRFKRNRRFVIISLATLMFPFLPVICFSLYKVSSELNYYYQRKNVSQDVISYSVIKPQNVSRIISTVVENDSLYLITRTNRKSNYSERIYFDSGGAMWKDQLRILLLNRDTVLNTTLFCVDTIRNKAQLYWDIHTSPQKECHSVRSGEYKITIENLCTNYIAEIEGFSITQRGDKHLRRRNELNIGDSYFYLFYVEELGERLSKLQIAEVSHSSIKVYIVNLEKGDEKMFDAHQIVGLFKKGNKLNIIADTAILQFNVK